MLPLCPQLHGASTKLSGPVTDTEIPIWDTSDAGIAGGHRGESAGGISPPAALRTGRDSLPSSGPHSPACDERDKLPVGEKLGLVQVNLL